MYNLKRFFRATTMFEKEDVYNAVNRNLSCESVDNLIQLRNEAKIFVTYCDQIIEQMFNFDTVQKMHDDLVSHLESDGGYAGEEF